METFNFFNRHTQKDCFKVLGQVEIHRNEAIILLEPLKWEGEEKEELEQKKGILTNYYENF